MPDRVSEEAWGLCELERQLGEHVTNAVELAWEGTAVAAIYELFEAKRLCDEIVERYGKLSRRSRYLAEVVSIKKARLDELLRNTVMEVIRGIRNAESVDVEGA